MKTNYSEINSFLSFKLDDEDFAVHVKSVLNILEMIKVTKVPKAPSYMKGVINLRGEVLPVIDLRLKFGMSETLYTDKTCIVVMEVNIEDQNVLIGTLVDEVSSVMEFDKNEILPPPSIGSKFKSEFIDGMAKVGDKFFMILNIDKVYTGDELTILRKSSENMNKKNSNK